MKMPLTPRSLPLVAHLTTLRTAVLGSFLLLAGAALPRAQAADTIFAEDFESYTAVATGLTDMTDADPTHPNVRIVDDTPLGGDDGSGVQVIDWLAHSGTKALLVRSSAEAQVNLVGARSGQRYQLDFWLSTAKDVGDRNFMLILRGEGSDHNGDDYLAYRSDRAATQGIFYYDGVGPGAAAWVNTSLTHTDNAWQHHRFIIDPNALTFDLYLDNMDTPAVGGAELARCEIALPTLLRIVHEGNSADDGYFIIDDISLTVDGSTSLATTFSEGFESYTARTDPADDADPKGPWITTEVNGTGSGKDRVPEKVQVVNNDVVPAHSGTKCLKIEGGQRAGATIAWGVPPLSDVQITWWARVPASVAGTTANYLRMSLYGAENGNTLAGDNALLGYGSRDGAIGDETSLTYYATAWVDTGIDYAPDTWEEYRLITHTSQGRYTIIKGPSSAEPQIIVDRGSFIGSATNWAPVIIAAWSSSNGSGHPPVYIDDVEIKSIVSNPDPLPDPYTVAFAGTRFNNVTILPLTGPIGDVVVDPRDNTTIVFGVDVAGGGLYRATKTGSGTWQVDSQPVTSGLDRPSGLTLTADGTLWWTHDYNNNYVAGIMRLKAPWASNTPEIVIADFGDPLATNPDDDAIDLTVAPANFDGSLGKPGMIIIADRGHDGDANNAVYYLDPATTELNQVGYSSFLVAPTSTTLGSRNLNAIAALPQSGEVITVSADGFLSAIDAEGAVRNIWPPTLWADPFGPVPTGLAIAVDPQTGRLWIADDLLDEVWSVSVDATNPTADQKELSFPLTNAQRPDRQLMVHDPGMAFSPDGQFMVMSDTSTANGGGRLLIFHNETIAPPAFRLTRIARTAQGVELEWEASGTSKYRVERTTQVANPASFTEISGDLTTTSFTDTSAPAGEAYYRVKLVP